MTPKQTAKDELQRAALELFTERGYEATTAADIAARVGVTERTFFRHFPDKREVLFGGEDALATAITTGVAALPPGTALLDGLRDVFVDRIAPIFAEREESARARAVVVAGSSHLQEREVAKGEVLRQVIASALASRGVAARPAHLAAALASAALHSAVTEWFASPGSDLAHLLEQCFDEAADLTTAAVPGRRPG